MKRILPPRCSACAAKYKRRVKPWRSNATGQTAAAQRACRITASWYTSGITTTDLTPISRARRRITSSIIDNILARNGIDKTRVLTAAITLADMADYGAFNAVWDAWVVDGYEPARSVTGGQLAVPEYKIKISVTAAL